MVAQPAAAGNRRTPWASPGEALHRSKRLIRRRKGAREHGLPSSLSIPGASAPLQRPVPGLPPGRARRCRAARTQRPHSFGAPATGRTRPAAVHRRIGGPVADDNGASAPGGRGSGHPDGTIRRTAGRSVGHDRRCAARVEHAHGAAGLDVSAYSTLPKPGSVAPAGGSSPARRQPWAKGPPGNNW